MRRKKPFEASLAYLETFGRWVPLTSSLWWRPGFDWSYLNPVGDLVIFVPFVKTSIFNWMDIVQVFVTTHITAFTIRIRIHGKIKGDDNNPLIKFEKEDYFAFSFPSQIWAFFFPFSIRLWRNSFSSVASYFRACARWVLMRVLVDTVQTAIKCPWQAHYLQFLVLYFVKIKIKEYQNNHCHFFVYKSIKKLKVVTLFS